MPTTSITIGTLLVLIGLIGYGYGLMSGHASPTALIPAAFGIVLIVFGSISRTKENLRKQLMHAAVLVALLGFVMTAGRLLMKIGELTLGAAVVSQLSTAIVCLLFVILAVRSFIAARRSNG